MELLEQDDGGACDKLAGWVQGCAYLARGGGRRTPAGRADRWRTAAEVGADPACGTQTGREGELLFERACPLLAVMYAKKKKQKTLSLGPMMSFGARVFFGGVGLFAMMPFVWTSHQESHNFNLTLSLDVSDETSSFNNSKLRMKTKLIHKMKFNLVVKQ